MNHDLSFWDHFTVVIIIAFMLAILIIWSVPVFTPPIATDMKLLRASFK